MTIHLLTAMSKEFPTWRELDDRENTKKIIITVIEVLIILAVPVALWVAVIILWMQSKGA